jgi:hypothetical protein
MKRETKNPRESLESSSVATRAAAIRDLEKFGVFDDIAILMGHAKNDSSVAIRLMAADAVSDILSRRRLNNPLSVSEYKQVRGFCAEISPRNNHSLYLVYASLGTQHSLDLILSGLRNTEAELRLGAAVGLQRFVVSYTSLGNSETEEKIIATFKDPSMKADALAHVAQVCAAVGYRSAMPYLRRIDLAGKHGETITQSQDRLRGLHRRPYGLWVSDGRDGGEYSVKPSQKSMFCAIGRRGISILEDGSWKEEGSIFHLAHRQMWFRRIGEAKSDAALQFSKRTWYRSNSKKAFEILKTHCVLGPYEPAYLHLAEALQLMFPDWKSKDHRDLGLMYMRAHAFDHAIECFDLSLDAKRTPLDVWIYKGDALFAQGDMEQAQALWADCLTRVRSQSSAIAQLCRARIAQLTKDQTNET